MAEVIKINEDLKSQKDKINAKNEKKVIENNLKEKVFNELTNQEKDDLLKLVAIRLRLIKE